MLFMHHCSRRNRTRSSVSSRDGNGAGFFGYSPRPAPNGTGLNFIKRVWGGFGNGLKNPERVRGGGGYCPTPPRSSITFLPLNSSTVLGMAASCRRKPKSFFSTSKTHRRGHEEKNRKGKLASPGCDVVRFNNRRSDRGGTAAVREGGAAAGVTHGDLIAAALRQYAKEGRRLALPMEVCSSGIARILSVGSRF